MSIPVDSLAYAPTDSPLTDAARWVLELVTGPAATIIAVIAVAMIGFALLQGRVDLRRGAAVIIGIFIVFGAPAIASALLALTQSSGPAPMIAATAPPPIPAPPPAAVMNNPAYDPYAGAAVGPSR